MKADDDDMLPEYDFSRGVRGRYANRFTAAEREEFLHHSSVEMVRELSAYVQKQVQALEGALFTFFVLARDEPVQMAAEHAADLFATRGELADLAGSLRGVRGLDQHLIARLQNLAREREWVAQVTQVPYTGPGSLNPVADRLDMIYDETRCLRALVDGLIENYLARSGLSEQEIEQKTEETARLWLAA